MNWADITSFVPLDRFLSFLGLDDVVSYRNTATAPTGIWHAPVQSYLPHKFAIMVLQMIRAFYEQDRQECLWLEYELWLHVHANELDSVIFGSTPRDELHRIFTGVFGLSPRACFNTFHQLVAWTMERIHSIPSIFFGHVLRSNVILILENPQDLLRPMMKMISKHVHNRLLFRKFWLTLTCHSSAFLKQGMWVRGWGWWVFSRWTSHYFMYIILLIKSYNN